MDIIYSRILLEFSGSSGAFLILFIIFTQLGICRWPADILTMCLGYALIVCFSFGFVIIMAALTELSESFERVSHIITYLMLPFTGVFFPLFLAPPQYRNILLDMPLVDAVEFFHSGYYGHRMPTYYHLYYTIFMILAMILFGYLLTNISIRKIQLT
jgi:capsular polysaccharide transport system permease protein